MTEAGDSRFAAPLWARLVATFFGIGYLRPGPGTWASAATVLLWWALTQRIHVAWQLWAAVLLAAIAVLVGIPAATQMARASQLNDPQFVVIDEVAGQHLTLLLPLIPIALPNLRSHMDLSMFAIFFALSLVNWKYLLLGFVFFRIFDVWKPFPVRWLERLPGGWGIMCDDWAASVYAAILLRLALHFKLI